jgi:hypothetical protein
VLVVIVGAKRRRVVVLVVTGGKRSMAEIAGGLWLLCASGPWAAMLLAPCPAAVCVQWQDTMCCMRMCGMSLAHVT